MLTPRAARKADQLCRARGGVGTRAPGWHSASLHWDGCSHTKVHPSAPCPPCARREEPPRASTRATGTAVTRGGLLALLQP